MKNFLIVFSILCFLFFTNELFSQGVIEGNKDVHDQFSEALTWFFTAMIGIAILLMLFMLYKVVVIEGNNEGEFDKRVLSFFVGLLLVVALDVIAQIRLSELIISSFTNVQVGVEKKYFSAGVITVIAAIFGALMSWHIHRKLKDAAIGRRLFVLISTIVLFYMIRVYVAALAQNDLQPMIANLAFIIGYAFILILTPKPQVA